MNLIIDCDYNNSGIPFAFQFINIDPAAPLTMNHPDISPEPVNGYAVVNYVNQNPDSRTKGGWDEISSLPGLPEGTTRWQVVVNTCNHSKAPQVLRDLNIKP